MRRGLACGCGLHRHSRRQQAREAWRLTELVGDLGRRESDISGIRREFVTLVPGDRPSAERIARSQAYGQEATMMSSCDYDFEPGRQYLIYARRTAEGRWTTAMCAGTKPVEDAAADLDYLATIPGAEPMGRVYGSVERAVDNPADRTTSTLPSQHARPGCHRQRREPDHHQNRQGRKSESTSRCRRGIQDRTGRAGNRSCGTGLPFRRRCRRGAVRRHFPLTANGRIEGRVVRPDGTPVPGTSVDVHSRRFRSRRAAG